MEPTASHSLLFALFLSLFFQIPTAKADNFYNREDIQARLEAMDLIVQPRYTTEVESYIKGYLARDGAKAALIIARTVVYFPIFEEYLEAHNMPNDLKYLAVVESALNPRAVSRVGATGLWQFMKETGAGYGLRITSRVDERSCPHRSTEAAMKYLASAYERFGSWELALASYNCGAGNVLRAMRRAGGSNDYWTVSKYLPRETRNFVPAFLGAAYVMENYHHHDITPTYPSLDLQLTEGTKVFTELPFATIAAVAGLPLEIVQELNPQYKREYVPAYSGGHYVVLPRRAMPALKDYLYLLRPDNGSTSEMPELPALMTWEAYTPDEYYYKTLYTVGKGEQLKSLGKAFACAGINLKAWNNLASMKVVRGQELVVWFPKELRRFNNGSNRVEVLPVVGHAKSPATPHRVPLPQILPIEPIELAPLERPELEVPAVVAERNAGYLLEVTAPAKFAPLKKVKHWVQSKGIFEKKN